MKQYLLLFTVLGLLLGLYSCRPAAQRPDKISFLIVESTDVHGSFFPYDLVRQQNAGGSLAQGQTWLRAQRAKDTVEIVLLDNGDIMQGTPVIYYANFIDSSRSYLLARMMNFMHYDAASVGNHDIEAGPAVYERFRKQANFPYLAANALDSTSKQPHFEPYTIIRRQGVKIAVLGLITPSIPNWLPEKLWPGMYFEDMISTARHWVGIIQEKEQPDLIIGLFHAGVDATYGGASPDEPRNENAAMLVAERVPGFDIVFAGHDHKPLSTFVRNTAGDSVLVLNAGGHAHNFAVASVNMVLDKNTKDYRKQLSGHLEDLSAYPADSIFMVAFASYFDSVEAYVNQKVVELDTAIRAHDALYGPSAYVDMIHRIQLDYSGADISFAAPFSTNAVLDKGPLYIRDMFKLYRYENFLCTMKLSGEEVRRFLEYSTSLWFDSLTAASRSILLLRKDASKDRYGLPLKNAYYNFDSGAGIKYTVDLRKARGQRVKILSMADGSAFDPEKTYTVVMNSYRANGGGGHLTKGAGLIKEEIKQRLLQCSDRDFRMILTEYLQKHGRFKPQTLNAWALLPEKQIEKMVQQ